MSNPPPNFFHDRDALENWLRHNPSVKLSGRGIQAPGADLSGLNLAGADFLSANLEGARFDGADLSNAVFNEAQLEGASLKNARLSGTSFAAAKLDNVSFEGATGTPGLALSFARMSGVHARGLNLTGANLNGAYLEGADLRNANLSRANLSGANLLRADIRGADLYGAELTSTMWGATRLDRLTGLSMTTFRPQHDSPNDRSDVLALSRLQRTLSWTSIRFLAEVPLFGGSYALLVMTLLVVSAIQWLNLNPFVQSFHYPIPVPPASRLLLTGSTLLALGATVFELACPARIKEFSRVRWVEELGRPGVLYSWDALKRPIAAAVSGALVTVGGFLVGTVFVERLVSALRIVVSTSL